MGNFSPDVLYQHLRTDLEASLPPGETLADDWWPGASPTTVAAIELGKSFYKKFVVNEEPTAEAVAWSKFAQANAECADWALHLVDSWDEVLWNELKHSIHDFWYRNGTALVSCYGEILDRADVGPGASIGARGTDFYTKLFDSPLSTTRVGLYDVYVAHMRDNNTRWSYAEKERQDQYGNPVCVAGSRMSFVQKTVGCRRSVATEPNLNMFFQKGFGDVLGTRLREVFNIDLSLQPEYNRLLAYIGSVSDEFASIDLSSASDRISLRLCEELLPHDFISWLKLLRSSVTEYRGATHDMHMVSSMGNGFCFPLQTMLFACIILACMRARGMPIHRNLKHGSWLWPGNFGCFGDDMIVHKDIVSDVLRLLRLTGAVVNTDKTFVVGSFRESCGYDYYMGHNVRGVYIKHLRRKQDRYVAINRLVDWSARTGIALPRTLRYLIRSVPKTYVPQHESDDAGIRAPLAVVPRLEVHNDTGAYVYRCHRTKKKGWQLGRRPNEVVRTDRSLVRRGVNQSGLLLAFLRGDIRKGRCDVRLNVTLYTTKRMMSSSWDYIHTGSLPGDPKIEQRTAAYHRSVAV